jgi:hypothetical protein
MGKPFARSSAENYAARRKFLQDCFASLRQRPEGEALVPVCAKIVSGAAANFDVMHNEVFSTTMW